MKDRHKWAETWEDVWFFKGLCFLHIIQSSAWTGDQVSVPSPCSHWCTPAGSAQQLTCSSAPDKQSCAMLSSPSHSLWWAALPSNSLTRLHTCRISQENMDAHRASAPAPKLHLQAGGELSSQFPEGLERVLYLSQLPHMLCSWWQPSSTSKVVSLKKPHHILTPLKSSLYGTSIRKVQFLHH